MRLFCSIVVALPILTIAACNIGGNGGTDLRGAELGIVIPDTGGADLHASDVAAVEASPADTADPGTADPDALLPDPGTTSDPGLADPGPSDPGTVDVPVPVDPGPVDTTTQDAGCTVDKDCGAGMACLNHNCLPCNWDDKCGTACAPCKAPTPHCLDGACVVCAYGAECGDGQFCDKGVCTACGQDDPAHCGSDCEPCTGQYPSCVAGECTCTEASCGAGLRCLSGKCSKCESVDACGDACEVCADPNPYCVKGKCAFCIDDTKCPEDQHCSPEGACVPDCLVTDGCTTNETPDGKACGKARTIGRMAALAGYVFSGSTTNGASVDDVDTGGTACWDADHELFFRIWLLAGEKLDVVLTPKTGPYGAWDSMMKLYAGTLCEAQGATPIACYQQGYEGSKDTISAFTPATDGWYTLVVDGRRSVDDDEGPFTLEVKLACKEADCCCQ